MDLEFWQEKWQRRDIAFHQAAANPLLVRSFKQLALAPGARVFLPLCGKSLDIHWLLAQGYQVVGAELSEMAVQELFAELGLVPTISSAGNLKSIGSVTLIFKRKVLAKPGFSALTQASL